MSEPLRIGFLGGGFMAEAILRALIERGVATAATIAVCEIVDRRREELVERYGVRAAADPAVLDGTAVVFLAVKPGEFGAAAAALGPALGDEALLVSIMAGVRLVTIGAALPGRRLVRSMPSTPAAVGEAFTMWIGGGGLDDTDRATVRRLLAAFGREYEATDEKYLDMATAVGGSLPGFAMLIFEAMIDGGVLIGLPRVLATEMVVQTMLGAARWQQVDGMHPAALRAQVVSPGGTTAVGLLALERGGVRAALAEALLAAYEKSRALGG